MCLESVYVPSSQHELILRHLDLAKSIAWKWSRHTDEFDENYSECCLKLVKIAAYWQPRKARFSTYVYTCLVRHLSHLRRQQSRRFIPPIAESPDKPIDTTELDKALDSLSVDEAEVIAERFFQGQGYRAIGRRLGVSRQRAHQKTVEIIEKLKERMGAA